MFKRDVFCYGLILVRLFYYENKELYHSDYFNELVNIVRDIETNNPCISSHSFCLEVMSSYLYSSHNRFDFAKKFVNFCKKFCC